MDDDVTGLDHTDAVDQLEAATTTDGTGDGSVAEHDDELVEELLIEEISIDGMCGVY